VGCGYGRDILSYGKIDGYSSETNKVKTLIIHQTNEMNKILFVIHYQLPRM